MLTKGKICKKKNCRNKISIFSSIKLPSFEMNNFCHLLDLLSTVLSNNDRCLIVNMIGVLSLLNR